MPWVRARFKDSEVWAEADASGRILARGGRVAIRYQNRDGAKVYNATASNVVGDGGAPEAPAPGPRASGRGSGFGSARGRTAGQAAAARDDLAARIAALPPGTHLAFTDGACKGNPGPAGAAAVLRLADGRHAERAVSLGRATNNVGELTAVGLALDLLEEAGVDTEEPVALFSDSEYAAGVLVKGWKARANAELIARLKGRLRSWPRLQVQWTPGHAGVPENERADRLATEACR
jgi:ribonuclease HI